MFRVFKRMTGIVTVTEKDGFVTVEGVSSFFMEKDLQNIWKTSRVGTHLFTKVGRFGFTLHSFFALDLRYILEQMLEHGKQLNISRRTCRQIIDGLNENTWLKDTQDDTKSCLDFSKLSSLTVTPLEHQRTFLEYYDKIVPQYNLSGIILAAAPGSGKTLTAVMLAECLKADHVIVVCPKNALDRVWQDTLAWAFKKPRTVWSSNSGKPYTTEEYAVCHYDYLSNFVNQLSGLRGRVVVILDESHNLNEMSSLRTQIFIEMCKKVQSEHVVWMSGTSFKALGYESIPVFSTIDPRFNEDIIVSFKKMFGKEAKKAIDILAHRVDLMSFKVEKKELNLTQPEIKTIKIKTPDAQLYTLDAVKKDMDVFIQERTEYYKSHRSEHESQYKECIDTFKRSSAYRGDAVYDYDKYRQYVNIISTTTAYDTVKDEMIFCNKFEGKVILPNLPDNLKPVFKNVKSVVKYTPLKIRGECLGRVLGKKRMECIRSIAQHFDYAPYIEATEKKTLVFTSYVEALEMANTTLMNQNYNTAIVYGKTTANLGEIVKTFGDDESINPLIATFQSLSTAVPMTMADVMIMLNTPFRDYVYQQAISRIHRIGATTTVRVFIAALDTGNEPNLSTRNVDILSWSQSQVEKIMKIKNPFPVDPNSMGLESIDIKPSDDYNLDWVDTDMIESIDGIADKKDSLLDAAKNWVKKILSWK